MLAYGVSCVATALYCADTKGRPSGAVSYRRSASLGLARASGSAFLNA